MRDCPGRAVGAATVPAAPAAAAAGERAADKGLVNNDGDAPPWFGDTASIARDDGRDESV